MAEFEKEANANVESNKQKDTEGSEQRAIQTSNTCIINGKCIDMRGHTILSKDGSLSILKVLLTRIAPTLKGGNYKSMKHSYCLCTNEDY